MKFANLLLRVVTASRTSRRRFRRRSRPTSQQIGAASCRAHHLATAEALERRLVLSSFYVSPAGDDTNAGTLAAPFASIARGMDAAQPGDSVLLRAGTYRETVSSVRSGTAAQPITVESYNGEEVFVTAAGVVDGSWTETATGSGIYSTSVAGGLPSAFWTSSNATENGSSVTETGGKFIANVANESPFKSRATRSQTSSDAWNFFTQPVTWKVRGLSFDNVGTPDLPRNAMNGYFTVMAGSSGGFSSDDSVNVRYKGNGQLALLLKKDTPSNWGSNAGAATDVNITGFDLTLGPGSSGNVDYTLTAVPSGQVVATGAWAMTQADWSDSGDGSQSFVQIFAQESENSAVDPNQKFELKVDSYEISASGQSVFRDDFDNNNLTTVAGNNPLQSTTISTGYDQIFVDGEMQTEARDSNRISNDLLTLDGVNLTMNDTYVLTSSAFDGEPDDYYAGARFLGRVGQGWAWQAAVVNSSSGNALQLDETSASTWWWPNQQNGSSSSGTGFVYGKLDFLDADREWHIQQNSGDDDTLYLKVVGGADPAGHVVERKVREWTVNVSGHDNIIVKGLNLRGGAVRLDGSGNIFEDNDARYLSHYQTFSKGGQVDGGLASGGGIVVSGDGNVVRGNTIYDTAGSGVVATGTDHLITRNHIHNIDYSGTYATGVSLSGRGHTLTFNTIHDTGRDNVRPTGAGLTVTHNDLSRPGRLAHDAGMIYTFGQNGLDTVTGRKTRIAYNWIHELGDPADALGEGIYLDNFTQNYIVDHNVIWDIGLTQSSQQGINLNAPMAGVEVYHNTLVGAPTYNTGTWTPFPDNNPNSTFWNTANHGMDYIGQNNFSLPANANFAAQFEDFAGRDFRPTTGSAAIDPATATGLVEWQTTNGSTNVPGNFSLNMRDRNQPFFYHETSGNGVALAGINDGFSGVTPDNGAYEAGAPRWTAGVDGVASAALTVTIDAATVSETGSVSATVTRDSGTTRTLQIALASSDVSEATVPASVTIPDGDASVEFTISGVNDNIIDALQTVTITASESGYVSGLADINVTDSLAHRMSNLTITVQDQFGNPLPDATIDVAMTQHAFQFGTQVQDRFLTITQAEFDALPVWQRHDLIGDRNQELPTPVWQDVVNYRTAVYDNFNHIIPTNGLQWVQYRSTGPVNLDRAIAEAQSRSITVTGHAVVWQNDAWPTPTEFRPDANPDPQEFHDALISDRLSTSGVMTRFSDDGAGPTVLDWDVLNEPIHEKHYSSVFVAGGVYSNENEAYADYFIRADALRPDATLAVNDYNILSSGSDAAARQYRDLVNDLLALGAPIDQIKIQAHMGRVVSRSDITRRLDILAETGLPIAISEFDMRDDANQISAASQKQLFQDMLEAIFEHPAVSGFSMWGIWDSAHWRSNGPLFDADWNVKEEASPWFDLVRGEWMPNLTDVAVESSGTWTTPAGLFDGTYRIVATDGELSTTIDSYELTADGQLFITINFSADGSSTDIDNDGIVNATTDGILAIRHMFGFVGDALIDGAVGAGATNDTAAEVKAVLDESAAMLDVDGDGTINATTDGILFIRYLFGFTGTTLTDSAIGAGAIRTTGSEVVEFLDGYQPSAPTGDRVSHFAVIENVGDSQTFNWGMPVNAAQFKLTIFNQADDTVVDSADTVQATYTPSVALGTGTYRTWLVATNLSGEVVSEFFATFTILVPDE